MTHLTVSQTNEGKNELIKTENNDGCVFKHKEFVPPGQTVSTFYHVDVLERLRRRVLLVRKDLTCYIMIGR